MRARGGELNDLQNPNEGDYCKIIICDAVFLGAMIRL